MRIVSITVLLLLATTIVSHAARADQVEPSQSPAARGPTVPNRANGQSDKASWSLRNLWPFGGDRDEARRTARREVPWDRLEASRPRPIDPTAKPPRQPSAFQRLASRTKESWQRTTRRLTPSRNSMPKGSTYRYPKRTEPSLFERWFGSRQPETKEPQSVKEWLGQPRPSAGTP